MRTIEEKIIKKLAGAGDGQYNLSVRDSVRVITDNEGNRKAVYTLWSSPVVEVQHTPDRKLKIQFSFCDWQSQTTKNRISEILYYFTNHYIFQKNWKLYVHFGNSDYAIDAHQPYYIKDGTLFDLQGKKVPAVAK